MGSVLASADTLPLIYLDEKPFLTEADGVFIENGYTMVPVKNFAEWTGIKYEENTYGYSLILDDVIHVENGNTFLESGPMRRSFGVKIKVVDNTLYAPLDPLCDVLGFDCSIEGDSVRIKSYNIPTNQFRVYYYEKNDGYQLIKTEIVPDIDMTFPEEINGKTYENLEIVWKGDWDYDGEMLIETNPENKHRYIYINDSSQSLNGGIAVDNFGRSTNRIEFKVNRVEHYKMDHQNKEMIMDGKHVYVKFTGQDSEYSMEELVEAIEPLKTNDMQIQYISSINNTDRSEVTVSVGPSEKAIFLILTSSNNVDWTIENPNNVDIKGIIHSTDGVSSWDVGSRVINPKDIPVFEFNSFKSVYFINPQLVTTDEESYYVADEFKYENQMVVELFGRRVNTFSSIFDTNFVYTPKEIVTDEVIAEMNAIHERIKTLYGSDYEEYEVYKDYDNIDDEIDQWHERANKLANKTVFNNVVHGIDGFKGYYITEKDPRNVKSFGEMTKSINFDTEKFYDGEAESVYSYFIGDFTFEDDVNKFFYYDSLNGSMSITIDGKKMSDSDTLSRMEHTFSSGTHVVEVEFISYATGVDPTFNLYMDNVVQYKEFEEVKSYLKTHLNGDTKLYYVESESDLDDQIRSIDFDTQNGDAILIIETNKPGVWRLKNHENMDFRTIIFLSDMFTDVRLENVHKNNLMRAEYTSEDLEINSPISKTDYDNKLKASLDRLKEELGIKSIDSNTSVFNEETIVIGNSYPLKRNEAIFVNDDLVTFNHEINEYLVIGKNKTIYVPLLTITKAMGIQSEFSTQTKELIMKKGMIEVTLKHNDPFFYGGSEKIDEYGPQNIIYLNGVRYVRLDRLVNIFSYSVWWDLDLNRIDLRPTDDKSQKFIKREDIPKDKFRMYYYDQTNRSTFVMTEVKESLDCVIENWGGSVRMTRAIGELSYPKTTTVKMDLAKPEYSEPLVWINGIWANEKKLQTLNKGYNMVEVYYSGRINDHFLKFSVPQKDDLFYVDQTQLKEQLKPYVDEETEIHYVSLDSSGGHERVTELLVKKTDKPVVLFLNSSYRLNWNVKNPHNVNIKAIVYGNEPYGEIGGTGVDYTIDTYDQYGDLTIDIGAPKIIAFNGFENNNVLTPSFIKNKYNKVLDDWGFDKNNEIIKEVTGKTITAVTVVDKSSNLETEMIRYDEESFQELNNLILKWRKAKMFEYKKPENIFNETLETRDDSWAKHIDTNIEIPHNAFRAVYFDNRNPLNTQQTAITKEAGLNAGKLNRSEVLKKVDYEHLGAYFVGTFDFEEDVVKQLAMSKDYCYARVYIDDVLVLSNEQERWDTNRIESYKFTKGSHKIAIEFIAKNDSSSFLFNMFEGNVLSNKNIVKDFVENNDNDKTKVHIVEVSRSLRGDGVVEVDLGTIMEPTILFLKSSKSVIWKLNNPNSIEVKGVVLDTRSYASDIKGYAGEIFKIDTRKPSYLQDGNEVKGKKGTYNYDSKVYASAYAKYSEFGVNTIDGYTQETEVDKASIDDFKFESK